MTIAPTIPDHLTVLFRCQVGSGMHGVTVAGQDDRDEMGMAVEGPEYVVGLRLFEQYVWRTQPDGARSGPGDLDLTIYSLRKWLRLALAGNPTVLLPLFVPEWEVMVSSPQMTELRADPAWLLSRQTAARFHGYMCAQRERLLGLRGKATNRPELVGIHGYDTKFAYHMLRLGIQGRELLSTGRITLPIPQPWRDHLIAVRHGDVDLAHVLAEAQEYEQALAQLTDSSELPPAPDRDAADRWLIDTYATVWEET